METSNRHDAGERSEMTREIGLGARAASSLRLHSALGVTDAMTDAMTDA
jgi:hypothetical protein